MPHSTGPSDFNAVTDRPSRHFRSMFLSDIHLGARGCKADRVLDFLRSNDADTIYLVGDILDTWHPLVPQWTPTHDEILRLLFRRAGSGRRVIYLPGNHDDAMRAHCDRAAGRFEVVEQSVHETADGRRLLVLHGDCADIRLFRSHLATRIGSRVDGALRALDDRLNQWGRTLHPNDRSLIEVLLGAIKAMMNFGDGFETRLTDMAAARGLDGVICGHSHQAALHDDHGGILYANCGDWVDTFTAIAEDASGRLSLIGWGGPVADPAGSAAPAYPFPGADAAGLAG